jgi:hypothetical protein
LNGNQEKQEEKDSAMQQRRGGHGSERNGVSLLYLIVSLDHFVAVFLLNLSKMTMIVWQISLLKI